MRPDMMPSDSNGGMRLVYEYPTHTYNSGYVSWTYVVMKSFAWPSKIVENIGGPNPNNYAGYYNGPPLTAPVGYGTPWFSAVSDPSYGVHLVYEATDLTTSYAYRSSSSWTVTPN